MSHAACSGSDPELFHSEDGRDRNAALLICSGCPVARQCLEYGRDEQFGVYGGTTATQRGRNNGIREDPGVKRWLKRTR